MEHYGWQFRAYGMGEWKVAPVFQSAVRRSFEWNADLDSDYDERYYDSELMESWPSTPSYEILPPSSPGTVVVTVTKLEDNAGVAHPEWLPPAER
jgi:hypothetical protein